jgi:amino acid adenylation domain-containing protein
MQQALFTFDSRARLDGFVEALQKVIERHDVLRTALLWEGLSEPVQVVWRRAPAVVEEITVEAGAGEAAEQLRARFDGSLYRLDVRQAPLMRLVIAADRARERWVLLWLRHHLTGDQTSGEVIRREVEAHLLGRESKLPAPVPFRNFVAQARLGISREEHEAFFKELLGDVEEPTTPFGLDDVRGDGTQIVEAMRPVERELARRLRGCARSLKVSVASLCHLAFGRVLATASGRDEVVFGTVLFGRMQAGEGAERVPGLFINTLPMRIRASAEGVEESVRAVHAQLAELLRHEHAPLALAQRCSGVPAPAPLFSALLNYRYSVRPAPGAANATERTGIQSLGTEVGSNYAFGVSIDDSGDGFLLTALVQRPVDAQRVCEYMHTALEQLVEALERSPTLPVREVEVLPEAERRQLLVEWNATGKSYPRERCVHELIEAQAAQRPDAIAVVYGERQLSYAELNGRANRLARHLRTVGASPDQRVAICAERSVEMIVGMLAILKAGAAYVPLDPSYPRERLAYLVEDSEPVAVLTHGAVERSVRELLEARAGGSAVLDLEADAGRWEKRSAKNLRREAVGVTPEHLAYVIYTSGSTGQPKGVMVGHRGVINRLQWMQDAYGLEESEAVLQKTPFSFDVSVWEFFWPLASGCKLVMARPQGHKDPGYLAEVIREEGITTLHFVPSMLGAFLGHEQSGSCRSVRRVVCSGEELSVGLARECRRKLGEARLYNLYGPTETTVDVTAWSYREEEGERIPIGKPIANTHIYVLDPHGRPVPIAAVGELYIGGVGVARGYLNRAQLTAERFVPDPFAEEAGARMYRTGDLARYRADGEIEFLGRNDFQVKVRGYRIELGEIEARLGAYPGVAEAVVMAREAAAVENQKTEESTTADVRLVAYYTKSRGFEGEIEVEGLRSYLSAGLPEHMVPAAYVELAELPLTPNGKLDRKALPAPSDEAYGRRGYEEPRGETEQRLAQIWSEVLGVERVGRNDNFFGLGGHSLLAVTVIERMHRAELHVDVRALFMTPTLSAFAAAAKKFKRVAL